MFVRDRVLKSNENDIAIELITQYPLPPLNEVKLPIQLYGEICVAAPPSVIIPLIASSMSSGSASDI